MSSIPSVPPSPNTLRHPGLISLALVCMLAGCSSDLELAAPGRTPAPADETAGSSPAAPLSARARIVTLDVSLTVEDIPDAVGRLRSFAEEQDGYVEQGEVGRDAATLRLRIPVGELSAARAELRDLGEITSEREAVQDVTSERADLGARLRNARAREERLLALLSRQEESLSDVLAVEGALSRAREEIERLDAQARTLEDRVAEAHLVVQIRARTTPFWNDPLETIAIAARGGANLAWATVVGGVAVLAAVGPGALLLFLMAWVFYRATRFHLRRRRSTPRVS